MGRELTKRQIGHSGTNAHVRGLDGLRGLAVVGVVAYHLGWGWAKGGYLGVDTFLVLSGYLITSILLAEHARSGRIGLVGFWRRRARRLFPALVLLLAAVAVWCRFAVLPDEAHRLRLDALTALGFVSNWRFILTGQGYFAATAIPSLLRHTWSLAVEGQLYVIWAPVVVLLARRGRRWVAWAAGGAAVASAAWGVVLVHNAAGINRAYYGTDTRSMSFLVGAMVAAVLAGRSPSVSAVGRRAASAVGVVGLAVTGLMWETLSGSSVALFRGGLVAAAVAAAAVVVSVVVHPDGWVSRLLSVGVLRGLGRVSYGIYLWHWPLFLVLDHGRTGLSGVELLALRLGALTVATSLSWLLIERPILERRPVRIRRPAVVFVTGAVASAALVVPLIVPSGAVAAGATAAAAAVPASTLDSSPVRAAVFGDSVSVTLARGLMAVGPAYGVDVSNDGIVGCGVVTGTQLRSIGIVRGDPTAVQGVDVDVGGVCRPRPAPGVDPRAGEVGDPRPGRQRHLAAHRATGVRRLHHVAARPGGGDRRRWRGNRRAVHGAVLRRARGARRRDLSREPAGARRALQPADPGRGGEPSRRQAVRPQRPRVAWRPLRGVHRRHADPHVRRGAFLRPRRGVGGHQSPSDRAAGRYARRLMEGSPPARTIAIVPAYNEEAALPGVLAELRSVLPDVDVVVISDGSTDATPSVARAAGVHVAELPYNLGIGGALQTGFRFAARGGWDRAVQIDADGQHDPAEVKRLLDALDAGADLVVGSRFAADRGEGADYRVGRVRGGAMGAIRAGVRLLSGRRFTDTSSGFRGFSRAMIEAFAESYPSDYMDSVEALLLALRGGFTVVEVPVSMRPRAGGQPSTRNLRLAYHMVRLVVVMVSSASPRPRPQVSR